jgi:hypothetical protein
MASWLGLGEGVVVDDKGDLAPDLRRAVRRDQPQRQPPTS